MNIRTNTQKNKDGSQRTYLQLIHSYWDKQSKTNKSKTIMNLGRCDDAATKKQLTQLARSILKFLPELQMNISNSNLKKHTDLHLGIYEIYSSLWKQLSLDRIIKSLCPKENRVYTPERAIFCMVLHQLVEPDSRRDCYRFSKTVFDMDFATLELQHLYRAMDCLYPVIPEIEKRLFQKRKDLFNQEVRLALYDMTTCTVWGKAESDLFAYGGSKNRRSDKKQFKLGLLVDQTGFPIGQEVWKGNQSEIKTLIPTLNTLKERFGLSKVCMVLDRGFYGQSYFEQIEEKGYEYLCGTPINKVTSLKQPLLEDTQSFKCVDSIDKGLWAKSVFIKEVRYILVYSRERALYDKEKRDNMVTKIKEQYKGKSIKTLIKNPFYKAYVKNPSEKQIEIDEEKIKEHERWDGFFVIRTNSKEETSSLVNSYKSLWQIEYRFRDLKTNLEISPSYHWTEKRIKSLVFLCFLALILEHVLYAILKQSDQPIEYKYVCKELNDTRITIVEHDSQYFGLRPELCDKLKWLYKQCKIRPKSSIEILPPTISSEWQKT
jgi:transposase